MKPPLLEGETLIRDGIPCYLLDDGRENGLLVPADGHVFVTSYRIMFLGTPCNPQGTLYIRMHAKWSYIVDLACFFLTSFISLTYVHVHVFK